MRKPNAIIHMTGYGLVYGVLLAMLYIWVFLGSTSIFTIRITFNILFESVAFALIFGSIPGVIMGFIEGWILRAMTRNIALPMTQADFEALRNKSAAIISTLTALGMGGIMTLLFSNTFSSLLPLLYFFVFPTLIAGSIATYASNRYMKKLWLWGSNAEKSKNEANYKPKNQLSYEDTLSENNHALNDAENSLRMKKG